MKKRPAKDIDAMEGKDEEELEVADGTIDGNTDLCQRLMERYGKSSAPQHRHLCASAAAMRAMLQDEGLPFTPPAYFAAVITAINDASETLDSDAIAALSSLLSILIPLVPPESLPPSKASEAVTVLVKLLNRPPETVSTATVRSVIKSLGFLIGFCQLEDWDAVKFPFETIIKFSVDKRPKVRRCAQVCIGKVFQSLQCSIAIKKANKMVLSLLRKYMPLAIELSVARTLDGSKSEVLSKSEHLEIIHMLNALKLIAPYLSDKVSMKILKELYKLLTCQFSPLTRHVFNIIETFFKSSRAEVIAPEVENYLKLLASYVSSGENPMDTILSAANLIKSGSTKIHAADPSILIGNLPLVFGSLAGLLVSEASTASQAAGILKELISHLLNQMTLLTSENETYEDKLRDTTESVVISSICNVFENMLTTAGVVPNKHMLAVISDLLLKLGNVSYLFMKSIVLKIADMVKLTKGDMSSINHLQECIGSAVIAMGPENLLTLIPLTFHPEKLTCLNIWLVPILKRYVVGKSVGFFMKHIVPLAESLEGALCKVKKASLRHDLQSYAHGFWGLLPSFCRYPTDIDQEFETLAKLFIAFLKKDASYVHENIATALQELVNQNRNILKSSKDATKFVKEATDYHVKDSSAESRTIPSHYSKKIARRNIKVISSCSVDLIEALTDVFFISPPEKRTYLKEAMRCMASIAETSKVKKLFTSSLERFQLINGIGVNANLESRNGITDTKQGGDSKCVEEEVSKRLIVVEFACSLIEGANEDLIDIIFNYIKPVLQASNGIGLSEAYYTLSRIFEEHTWFYTSRCDQLLELLLDLKSPIDVMSLRSRFACFHFLLIHMLKSDLEEEKSAKVFLILNEIILRLKDSKEEARKAAYDVLLSISSSLKRDMFSSGTPHQRLFSMILGYLSGPSPHITSAAVSALSVLIYKDSDLCFSVPDLLPSVLVLLRSKDIKIIKAVLGFMKVVVSCLQVEDLQKILSDIVNGVLPWSSVSRHHFRSKVTVILEIMIRKCGASLVQSIVPDKYKGFIKTVLEQRHGKKSSKDGSTETALELADTSPKWRKKRAYGGVDVPDAEDGSRTLGIVHKRREKKRKVENSHKNEPHKHMVSGTENRRMNKPDSKSGKLLKGQPMDRVKSKMRELKKIATIGGKGKVGRKKAGKALVPGLAGSLKVQKKKKKN
ncbi:PREDICTED: RRP12-like protein [Nelumbo nucifera]|uniref:RRP12-like protein n=2 Tax=Nelumbo nucifera TaxID=4432 RepID=A0A1U7ZH63_NELNU|nr:PREDICTED: RRP12-like protein [Nelumbo nucifera]DAD42444.1 TPA_asm: hypothetical protein HUJ06_000674 [Nelumbo nucifera]